jgi:hypothetical protein
MSETLKQRIERHAEDGPNDIISAFASDILELINGAISSEREACAKVADGYKQRDPAEDGSAYWASEEIASAIRARG